MKPGALQVFSTGSEIGAAMLDRLLHKSVVFNIDGDSYRLGAHQARNQQFRPKGGNN